MTCPICERGEDATHARCVAYLVIAIQRMQRLLAIKTRTIAADSDY
jgi:hypothetical protein